jgi:hypothetical protein
MSSLAGFARVPSGTRSSTAWPDALAGGVDGVIGDAEAAPYLQRLPISKAPDDRCYYCGRRWGFGGTRYTRDHVLAKCMDFRGGEGTFNVKHGHYMFRLCCAECNTTRGEICHCAGALMLSLTEAKSRGITRDEALIALGLRLSPAEKLAARRAKSTRKSGMRQVTSEEIIRFRNETGCSMQEAELTLEKRRLIGAVDAAETVDDLRPVLKYLIERL